MCAYLALASDVNYSPAAWHGFFTAASGATAALLGLLFVAISINLQHILTFPHLPGRAAGTLGTLLSYVVVFCCGPAPGRSTNTYASEILIVGVLVSAQAVWMTIGKRRPQDPIN